MQDALQIRSARHIYFYSILLGALAATFAFFFSHALAYTEFFCLEILAGLTRVHPAGEISVHAQSVSIFGDGVHRWVILILPILGGLVVGWILHSFYPDASGAGIDAMVHTFHHREGKIKGRGVFWKSLATIFTLSTGGSGGREGPIAFIGAGLGSRLARQIGAGARARRTLLLAGVAGALGAIFRAPLGGAITAVEILYTEDFESDSLIPCIMSSVTGYLVLTGLTGPGSLFSVGTLPIVQLHEISIYIILGLVCYGTGFIHVKFFHEVDGFFRRMRISKFWKPALGGVVIGCIGFFYPEVLGSGFGYLQQIFQGYVPDHLAHAPMQLGILFLGIAALKIVATGFTIGSGGSGGMFAPSMFIGAMLGGAVASLTNYFLPTWNLPLTPFMLVGMGAFFAGVARAPIAAMIMVGDIVGSYRLLPPLMVVTVITLVLSHRWSLYKTQVKNRFQSPAHFWDMQLDLLDRMFIGDQFAEFRQRAIIKRNTLLGDLEDISFKIHASDFIVTNDDGHYSGVISLKTVRLTEDLRQVRNLITVYDVVDTSIPSVHRGQSLAHALRIITEHDVDKVAVIDKGTRQVLGYIRYHDIFAVYHQHLQKRPSDADSAIENSPTTATLAE